VAALDTTALITMQSVYNLHIRNEEPNSDDQGASVAMYTRQLMSVLAVLNSKAIRFFISKTFTAYKLLFPQMNQSTLEGVPLPLACLSAPLEMAMVVERMLALHAQRAAARTSFDATVLERQIAATDRQIDQLVYALYDLTDDEVRIVEAP
jgi:hypothetical protein